MNARDAETVLILLHHLDGNQDADTGMLLSADLMALHASAAAVVGCLPLDEDVLLDTLTQVTQRHADSLNYQTDYTDAP